MAPEQPAKRRRSAEKRGHAAEYWAALYLMLKGYRILALRHRTPLGEIDLIARRKDVIAFVEVKARRTEAGAVDAVSYASQKRIRASADLWLSRRRDAHALSLRFDIVAVLPRRLPKHFIGAF
ncbi:YraN family protein [Agrobacterium sp. rho-13.3]|jgi:putative endonuclease|uniref:YraN family protein n=1 Tax=Agrobacterium sp. rho-13.3 TaxID=3072980 RepID=UPI002A15E0F8|nr:YraN family protein [Agrobacterium sp. rho-13.3]MDX8309653.1 YraN family protein [Agrobacterium sp. rho-13.3]